MKKIITYGTFDLIHNGHIDLLKQAKEYGDYLIVALSVDELSETVEKTYHSYQDRKVIIEAMRYVDEVIPVTNLGQQVKDIQHHSIDVLVVGDDWKGKLDHLRDYCQVVYVPQTKGVSTSKTKSDLLHRK